jgi:DNA-binding NtrC family response regulator
MRRFFDVVDRLFAPPGVPNPAESQPKPDDRRDVHADKSVVLVVDDEPAMREALCDYLTQNDFTAIGVASAKDAYGRILELREHICVLITDMVIPGGGGWELARTARHVVPDLPVLFMSGIIDGDVVASASSQPYTRFLQKPFEFKFVIDELRSLIAERLKARDYS